MKKNYAQFPVTDPEAFKIKMLNWASRFNIFCFLDNNHYSFEQPAFEWIMAAGCKKAITLQSDNLFSAAQTFSAQHNDWLFGHFNYPQPASITSEFADEIQFPAGYFFIPQVMISLKDHHVSIVSDDISCLEIFNLIHQQSPVIKNNFSTATAIKKRYSREEYISIIDALKKHIRRGDCYEINFCQEFYAMNTTVDPLYLFHQLSQVSPNPFAAFYKLEDKFCICASPERFIKKSGNQVISQPIKGTSKRDLVNHENDEAAIDYLKNSEKEKSENVMIVDLVRNDLSRICSEGSVHVKELFGIYSFPQVHQMISTIAGTVADDVQWAAIIKACFPMGSMTGAPKYKVMELIDQYEKVPRGLFSGTIGYVNPNGDFDFNVVIRSLFFNASNKTLSFKVGSGITIYCDAESEYAECMLKAEAILKILQQ